ncbi:MAG: VOC family protein [bacterium]
MADPVVHFELPADNVERAQRFYSKAFGWKVNSVPGMAYTLFHTTPTDAQGMVGTPGNINGGMMQRQAFVQAPIVTIQVADIGKSLREVEANGGKVVRGKESVPGVGFTAYFRDPEGNTLGLVQSTR